MVECCCPALIFVSFCSWSLRPSFFSCLLDQARLFEAGSNYCGLKDDRVISKHIARVSGNSEVRLIAWLLTPWELFVAASALPVLARLIVSGSLLYGLPLC